jgi:hypothetical protein
MGFSGFRVDVEGVCFQVVWVSGQLLPGARTCHSSPLPRVIVSKSQRTPSFSGTKVNLNRILHPILINHLSIYSTFIMVKRKKGTKQDVGSGKKKKMNTEVSDIHKI